ncbi:c-type cytochrome [Puteibacter caeruleilacunae]|nr:c-type cytochrome [Puteibacter caeruleilacunae]
MQSGKKLKALFYVFIAVVMFVSLSGHMNILPVSYFSPAAITIDQEEEVIYVVENAVNKVEAYKLGKGESKGAIKTKLPPKDAVVAGKSLLIACSYSEGVLAVADKKKMKVKKEIAVGHGACAVTVSPDLTEAYVANQFSDDISIVNLKSAKEVARVPVLRQPKALDISKDGKYLYVANFLTSKRADVDTVCAEVSIIDIKARKKIKDIPLANGSNALRGIKTSADGKYVFISHNLGRFQVPTTQLEQGWMNTSALSVIDAEKMTCIATVLLDDPENGAAGSWGIECTDDHVYVAHSGTHDFSAIDYKKLIDKLNATENKEALSYDLRFLADLRTRVQVKGNGPRAIKSLGDKVFVASYFSDTLNIVDMNNPAMSHIKCIALNPEMKLDSVRLGEIYFNDATYCFQRWQSCNGCHPDEARTDGLNWDLLNDGMGNPKNCKSMLYAHPTAPAMISGIRPDAETAVRAGFRHIQFARVEESRAKAVDYYLMSLKAVPSPYLVKGKLSDKAEKGKKVFEKMQCGVCHVGEYFTDQKKHQIGEMGPYDHQNTWDTPTLLETWRTSPYLHDGRCATMKDVFVQEKHGIWSDLSEEEIDQLVEYVLSL